MDTSQIAAWIAAHPLEALMALGVVLNLVNGLLPSRVRSGPIGRAVHVLLDRVSVLTRSDAPGTLKWPIVVGSILRAGADAIDPPQPRAAERGHARPGALLVLVALAAGLYLATGCRTAREVVMRAAPGVPEVSGCIEGSQRCNGQLPEVCSASGRWWPSLPPRPDGTQRVCVSCVVEDGVAGCAAQP